VGFFSGSLALIALYTVSQPGVAAKLGVGSNVVVGLLHRALSPGVAGLPDRSKKGSAAASGASTGGSSSSGFGFGVGALVGQAAAAAASQIKSPDVGQGDSKMYENYYRSKG
jgi:hypothetical protein